MQLKAMMAVAAAALSAAACQYSPDTADRTLSYNLAVATSTENLFLLNAVRASQHQPTYFTRNASDSTTSAEQPALSGTVPTGSTATFMSSATTTAAGVSRTVASTFARAALGLTPSLQVTENDQLSLLNLDDQASTNGVLTSVTLQQISNYLSQGYSAQQLYMLYLGSITVPRTELRVLPYAIAETCATKMHYQKQTTATLGPNDGVYCDYFFSATPMLRPAVGQVAEKYIANAREYINLPIFYIGDRPDNKGRAAYAQNLDYTCFDGGSENVGPEREQAAWNDPGQVIVQYENAVDAQANTGAALAAEQARVKELQDEIRADRNKMEVLREKDIEAGPAVTAPTAAEKQLNDAIEKDKKILATLDTMAASNTSDPRDTVTIPNDPASDELNPDNTPSQTSYRCFYEVLTALLALDLQPKAKPATALFQLPATDVSDNPRVIADLTQQGMDIAAVFGPSPTDAAEKKGPGKGTSQGGQAGAPTPDDSAPATQSLLGFNVCKKAGDLTLSLSVDGYVKALFALGGGRDRLVPEPGPPPPIDRGDEPSHTEPALVSYDQALGDLSLRPSDVPHAIRLVEDVGMPASPGGCASAKAASGGADGGGSGSFGITFTPRTLESMVYYLGEVIRRQHSEHREPVTFLAWDARAGTGYQEELFRVREGVLPAQSLARASIANVNYFVPTICSRDAEAAETGPAECSLEYPDHSSGQVLGILNQIWGLNKTQTAAPTLVPVEVIP